MFENDKMYLFVYNLGGNETVKISDNTKLFYNTQII